MDNCIELETLRKWKTTVNGWTHLVKTDENISESIKNKRDSTMPSKILSHKFEFKYSYPLEYHHVSFKAKMFQNGGVKENNNMERKFTFSYKSKHFMHSGMLKSVFGSQINKNNA